jgi:NitT/TauT family transport system substrate-binding protein
LRGRTAGTRALIVAGLVAALAACSSGSGASPSGGGPSASTPATSPAGSGSGGTVPGPLDYTGAVRFGVFPNITHAPGLLALADGGRLRELLPKADIKVTPFNSGTPAVEAIFADALDITFIGPNPAINAFAKSKGEAVRVIAGSTSGGAFLVVKPEINSAGDLKGKKLASPSLGNTQDVALRSWLKAQGLTTDTAGGGDVSIVNQENAQTLHTFQTGAIDGAWLPEPWATRLVQEAGAKVLVNERDLWPEGKYVTTHLLVTTKFLEANPEVVKRILLATMESIDEANADPAAAQATVNTEIEKYTTKKVGTGLLSAAWKNLTFTVDPIASSLEKSAQDAQALDLLKDPGDLSKLYDLTLLNDLLASSGKAPVLGLE